MEWFYNHITFHSVQLKSVCENEPKRLWGLPTFGLSAKVKATESGITLFSPLQTLPHPAPPLPNLLDFVFLTT